MKTKKILICLLTVIAFASFSMNSYASGHDKKKSSTYKMSTNSRKATDFISQANMNLFSTPDQLIIQFDNPAQEYLTFVISTPEGVELMTLVSSEPAGDFVVNVNDLVAMGGADVYVVDMYSGDGKKKTESGTVVIVRE